MGRRCRNSIPLEHHFKGWNFNWLSSVPVIFISTCLWDRAQSLLLIIILTNLNSLPVGLLCEVDSFGHRKKNQTYPCIFLMNLTFHPFHISYLTFAVRFSFSLCYLVKKCHHVSLCPIIRSLFLPFILILSDYWSLKVITTHFFGVGGGSFLLQTLLITCTWQKYHRQIQGLSPDV